MNKTNNKNGIEITGSLLLNKNELLSKIKFNIELNKWNTLVGQSGIGKSTLLKALANLEIHSNFTNKIKIRNKHKYTFSLMAQDDLLLPWLSVIENVVLGQKLRREKVDLNRAKNILKKVNLSHVIDNMPSSLSGGMRQRVAIARTLFEDRDIILMDEPFRSLDSITKTKIQNLTYSLLLNKTIFMVTHDPLEALLLSNNLYLISDSKIKNIKLPKSDPIRKITDTELVKNYKNIINKIEKNYIENE